MRECADHLFVDNIAVDPRRQGNSLGTRLMAFAEAVARERGLPEIRLYTNVVMSKNFAFYRRLGFTETGRRREHGFDRVYVMKSLIRANRKTGVP
jgi:ribosomal protein S18 acetylase RimI-like enzyme